MSPEDKPLFWLSAVVRSPPLSAEARLEAGFLLRRLQRGKGLKPMDDTTLDRLTAAGWSRGDARAFLDLSGAEAEFIEMKLSLAEDLRALRTSLDLSQAQVARVVGSSQSRVAKMEAADSSVTVDLLIRTLLRLGAERKDVARAVAGES